MLKIENCICGNSGKISENISKEVFVRCSKRSCWFGPDRKTKAGAVTVWNRVMGDITRRSFA